jgi:hypothetical protein
MNVQMKVFVVQMNTVKIKKEHMSVEHVMRHVVVAMA